MPTTHNAGSSENTKRNDKKEKPRGSESVSSRHIITASMMNIGVMQSRKRIIPARSGSGGGSSIRVAMTGVIINWLLAKVLANIKVLDRGANVLYSGGVPLRRGTVTVSVGCSPFSSASILTLCPLLMINGVKLDSEYK
jgi:hypothetical protein